MGIFGDAASYLREGVADLTGVRDELDQLREANYAARAMARRFEDVGWHDLVNAYADSEYKQTEEARRGSISRGWNYYFDHPMVRRTVDVVTFYTFGSGVSQPTYTDNQDKDPTDEEAGNDAIKRFWDDPENSVAFTSMDAQFAKSLELQVQANIFFNLHYAEGPGVTALSTVTREPDDPRARPTGLKITDIPEVEIVDIIRHPGNKKIPLYYKRVFRPRVYSVMANEGLGGYLVDEMAEPVVEYFPDWRFAHLDPGVWNGRPWGPPAELRLMAERGTIPMTADGRPRIRMGRGRIYHVKVNFASDMKFGVSELQSYLKWAQGIDQYMLARMNTVLALAKLAMRAKVRGGPKSVSQTVSALSDMARLAGVVEGEAKLRRTPASDVARTRASVENQGVDLQPQVQDTNAGAARGDLDMMTSMVAAGSGVPGGHLGAGGPEALSAAVSKDGPMLKFMKARQQLWKRVILDLTGEAVRVEGLDPARVNVKMPPITEIDVAGLAAWMTGLVQSADPNVANRELWRWLFLKVLEATGEPNPQELVDRLLPYDQPTPHQQNLDAEEITRQHEEEELGRSQSADGAGAGRPTNPTTTMQTAAEDMDVERNDLLPRGGARQGGAAAFGRQSRVRARRRLGTSPVEAGLEQLQEGTLEGLMAELQEVLRDAAE